MLVTQINKWITQHLAEFNPFEYRDSAEAEARRKAFSELSIYLYVCGGKHSSLKAADSYVLATTTELRYLDLIRRDSVRLPLYAQPILYTLRFGNSNTALQRFISTEVDINRLLGMERSPYRTLELWHLFQSLEIDIFPIKFDEIESLSCLRYPPSPTLSSDMSVYALTHAIFYATDFGSGRQNFKYAGAYAHFASLLDVLTLRFIGERNFDVALELAICSILVGQWNNETLIFLSDEVSRQIEDNGVVESPKAENQQFSEVFSESSRHWHQNYHTMFIAGLFFQHYPTTGLPSRLSDSSKNQVNRKCKLLLCEALSSLGRQDLYRATSILSRLADFKFEETFKHAFTAAIEHVESQRTSENSFGYFVDEEIILRHRVGRNKSIKILAEAKKNQNLACNKFLHLLASKYHHSAHNSKTETAKISDDALY